MASRAIYSDTKIRVRASNLSPRERYTVELKNLTTGESKIFKQNSVGTFTNFAQNDQSLMALHTYMMYLKFGFGRATQDAGIEIRRGAMTRDQGLNLVNLYDNHYPVEFIDQYLDYFQMKKKEFDKIIDYWANKKIFKKKNGLWIPKFKIK